MSHPADYYDLSRLRPAVVAMLEQVDALGREHFAPRATQFDQSASFPTANYDDMRELGLLRLVVPEEHGGLGFAIGEYALVGAEIGKHCGATALTFNMHTSALLWSRYMAELPNLSEAERAAFAPMRERQFARAVAGEIFSQPISEGGNNWTSAPIATRAEAVDGGWRLNGRKKFASLAGHCDYYNIVCTEHFPDKPLSFDDTMNFCVHKDAPGLRVEGEWDPLGMRGTTSRDLVLEDVFVSAEDLMMPAGTFNKTLPNWPAMMALLSPAYMGVAQGAYDFTRAYLRGEVPGLPPIDRRVYPTKRAAMARMFQRLSEMRALWTNAMLEARGFPGQAEVMRLYAAQYAVMEGVQAIAALAIRTCGGQSMLKSLPLERLYRDSRCGALMLPYTSEIMEDYLAVLSCYQVDEIDDMAPDNPSARTSLWRGPVGA